jgi:hypothetical protein
MLISGEGPPASPGLGLKVDPHDEIGDPKRCERDLERTFG